MMEMMLLINSKRQARKKSWSGVVSEMEAEE